MQYVHYDQKTEIEYHNTSYYYYYYYVAGPITQVHKTYNIKYVKSNVSF